MKRPHRAVGPDLGAPAPAAPASESREQLAAVDLGSNSFHYVIASLVGGEPEVIDRHREQVQLARGLSARTGVLGKKAQVRALRCLERFRQRLEHIPPTRVRAVGTSTLRRARAAEAFLAQAEQALGHSIEIVSGAEEARLIYLGVAHSLPDDPGQRCVVDIGGGSTELVIGLGFEPRELHSVAMGCVDFTRRYFRKGAISATAFEQAVLDAARRLRPIRQRLLDRGWDHALGSSGTVKAALQVLRAHGKAADGITRADLRWLKKEVLSVSNVCDLKLDGLKPKRAPVFPAGLALLTALLDRLPLEPLHVASGALREGVLYDLLGRIRHEDVRQRTVRTVQERHRVDEAQADRVERTALALLLHAPLAWRLHPVEDARLLAWAARLHEIGLGVGLSAYHRHSAYLAAHADLPGFARDEQRALAALLGSQRRRLRTADFERLPPGLRLRALRLTLLLRWSVILNRSRSPAPTPLVRIAEHDEEISIEFPEQWLARHPLTRLDMATECAQLRRARLPLTVRG